MLVIEFHSLKMAISISPVKTNCKEIHYKETQLLPFNFLHQYRHSFCHLKNAPQNSCNATLAVEIHQSTFQRILMHEKKNNGILHWV